MGQIRCGLCENIALYYDDNVLPYLQPGTLLKAKHFTAPFGYSSPTNGTVVKCRHCDSTLLMDDIIAEWNRVRTKDWDI